jgi:hypothetical protein
MDMYVLLHRHGYGHTDMYSQIGKCGYVDIIRACGYVSCGLVLVDIERYMWI